MDVIRRLQRFQFDSYKMMSGEVKRDGVRYTGWRLSGKQATFHNFTIREHHR